MKRSTTIISIAFIIFMFGQCQSSQPKKHVDMSYYSEMKLIAKAGNQYPGDPLVAYKHDIAHMVDKVTISITFYNKSKKYIDDLQVVFTCLDDNGNVIKYQGKTRTVASLQKRGMFEQEIINPEKSKAFYWTIPRTNYEDLASLKDIRVIMVKYTGDKVWKLSKWK